MELHEAIRTIVDQFGKDIITERRFLYMLADYYSFRDNPAEKHVISAIVSDGHSDKLVKTDVGIEVVNKVQFELCRSYGFRNDLVKEVLLSFAKGLNISVPHIEKESVIPYPHIIKNDHIEENVTHNTLLFYLKRKGVCKNKEVVYYDASGVYNTNNGSITIKKGSFLSLPPSSYISLDEGKLTIKYMNNHGRYKEYNILRTRILNQHCKLQQPCSYVVESDIVCATPSEAAFIVTGYNYNGLLCWKDNNGMSLKDYKRHSLI